MKKNNILVEKAMKYIGIITVSIIVLIVATEAISVCMDWLIWNTDVFYELYNNTTFCEYTVGGLSWIITYRTIAELLDKSFTKR